MAKGSEQPTWRWHGVFPRVCERCGQDIRRLEDVREFIGRYDDLGAVTRSLRCVRCEAASPRLEVA